MLVESAAMVATAAVAAMALAGWAIAGARNYLHVPEQLGAIHM